MQPHHLRITFDVNVAPWRIDDPTDYNNADWSLWVFDRNLGQWVPHTEWKRPGESCKITRIEVVDE
jgi:hypothetical protein